MYDPEYLAELQELFKLQRRPYIAVADVLNGVYESLFQLSDLLSPASVAPFDFTVLKTSANGDETFRWTLGFDKAKFYHILTNKQVFRNHVNTVHSGIAEPRYLDDHYREILSDYSEVEDLEFLTAVFHLTYRFPIPPKIFNVGLIHEEHKHKDANYHIADFRTDLLGWNDLPYLQIGAQTPRPQVPSDYFERGHKRLEIFQNRWMAAILGFALPELRNRYIYKYHLYFPIYDSLLPTLRSTRGYLGIFCASPESRMKVLDFFHQNNSRWFGTIIDAYKRGIHNSIIDSYKGNPTILPPLEFWEKSIKRLHQWGESSIESTTRATNHELCWLEGKCYKLSLEKILRRNEILNYVDEELLQQGRGHLLSLKLPETLIDIEELDMSSPYLNERHQDLVLLLDDILRARSEMLKERQIRLSAQRSAVSAVMARNMSHNLGSHVLASFCRVEDFGGRRSANLLGKLATLNSFLRTRFDFLAHLSTSVPSDISSLKMYRDAISNFKPIGEDEDSGLVWQELLLDHISGIEHLKSGKIEILVINNGVRISLKNSLSDPVFACPNGLLGAHALYIILENIIRNSAKHSYRKNEHSNLNIAIQVKDCPFDKNLCEVCIYDNLGTAAMKVLKDGKNIDLIEYLNSQIDASILDKQGNLRKTAWGIMEMKVCAGYLRKKKVSELEEDCYPPLLEAIEIKGNLGYRLFLNRPPQLLIVNGSKRFLERSNLKNFLTYQSIEIVTPEEFKKRLRANIEHQFLILVEPDVELQNLVKKSKKALPIRIITTDRGDSQNWGIISLGMLEDLLENSSWEKTIKYRIWRSWLETNARPGTVLFRTDDNGHTAKWDLPGLCQAVVHEDHLFQLGFPGGYTIYDRHGEMKKKYPEELRAKFREGIIAYYQAVDYNNPTRFLIDYVSEDIEVKKNVLYGLLETALMKVIILDERIQKVICQNSTDNFGADELEMMNILVPCKTEIDLDHPRDCEAELTRWLKEHLPETTFFVVHLGIAEKVYNNNLTKMRRIFARIEREFPDLHIVVISGRGLPLTVRELEVRFIQYSQIAKHILEEQSKFRLTKALFSARRPTK